MLIRNNFALKGTVAQDFSEVFFHQTVPRLGHWGFKNHWCLGHWGVVFFTVHFSFKLHATATAFKATINQNQSKNRMRLLFTIQIHLVHVLKMS